MKQNTGINTPEIVGAILLKREVREVVNKLIDKKQQEFNVYKAALHQEEQFAKLLVESLDMPEGTAGRRVADAIVAELREAFPKEAAAADDHAKLVEGLTKTALERSETIERITKSAG